MNGVIKKENRDTGRSVCEDTNTQAPREDGHKGDRLDLCCHKPRNVWSYQKLEEASILL